MQRGDSRTRMGARFGENPVVLARENGLRFPSVLNVGITLDINNRHIVPKSDLIDGICRVHSCTVHPLMHEPKNRSLDLSKKWLKPSTGAGF